MPCLGDSGVVRIEVNQAAAHDCGYCGARHFSSVKWSVSAPGF